MKRLTLVKFSDGSYGVRGYDFCNNPFGYSYLDIESLRRRYSLGYDFNPFWYSIDSGWMQNCRTTEELALNAIDLYRRQEKLKKTTVEVIRDV